jgi:hypothetical protein
MMYSACKAIECDPEQSIRFPGSIRFRLRDKALVQTYMDHFPFRSCEYNFSNLFCWQEIYKYSWFVHKERLVIYDGISNSMFMPLGPEFMPEELYDLSHLLIKMGLEPNINIVPRGYIDKYPDIERFYAIQEKRDHAEYIYRTDSLATLTGKKLHKKRNLIAQFRRYYPDYSVLPLKGIEIKAALKFARNLLEAKEKPSKDLTDESQAMGKAFEHFDSLGLEGIVLKADNRLVAFSVFSPLTHDTYNIQFEKSDIAFKGAAQVINQETAKYLMDKCMYVNREQDLGIKGLRRAKLSYGPDKLLIPHTLKFKTNI